HLGILPENVGSLLLPACFGDDLVYVAAGQQYFAPGFEGYDRSFALLSRRWGSAGTHGMLASERDIAQAKGFVAPPGYRRHRPETTLLYQLVAEHYPKFRDRRVAEGRALPQYVEDEFEAYLQCGLLEHGFLRVKCDSCQAEKLVAFSCKRRGQLRFVPVPAPSEAELRRLVQRIAERIGRSLERSGLITRDIEDAYLAFDPGEEAPINALLGASITYRIATGPREGQKVFTLQT